MIAELLVDCRCELAEGIQWNARDQRLWWTDIHGSAIWSCAADGSDVVRRALPDRLGAFAFARDGGIIGAFATGLFRLSADLTDAKRISEFETDVPTTRYNDGRCDRQGRFIVGGMNEDGLRPVSSLTRFSGGTVETLRTGIGCSNAICFSPDGTRMYFADTPSRLIETCTYDPATGELGPWEAFHTVAEGQGYPDGACIDADGTLWNARFGGAHVQQIMPDGTPGLRIDLPVPNVTCACFGGPDLATLYITTAREHMTPDDLADAPLSGGIFAVRPGATGLPEELFAG